jgi:Cu/Ag efflux pump CusA
MRAGPCPLSVMLAFPISAFGAILTLTFIPLLTNNVYAQIGPITLIGLSARNATLIVEFAKMRVDRGRAGAVARKTIGFAVLGGDAGVYPPGYLYCARVVCTLYQMELW